MDWKYYDFNECEEKVKKAISPYFKAFEAIGITVDFVPDCDNPADDFCELYFCDYLVGFITPEVDTHEEDDSDDPNDFETHIVWDFDYIDVRITIMINWDRKYKNFYPKEKDELSAAVQAAKDFIILIKNEQIKKREEKLNEDF
jgi:hypothetical protein